MIIDDIEKYLVDINYHELDMEQLYSYIKCVTEIEKTKFEIDADNVNNDCLKKSTKSIDKS